LVLSIKTALAHCWGQFPCAYPPVSIHTVARCSVTNIKAWRAYLLAVKEQITITELTYADWHQIRPLSRFWRMRWRLSENRQLWQHCRLRMQWW
jgi:hypothetical protein